ncbi:hypothetical protein_gp297 [Bacillus phage vB_BceM_WH1]|nr:hypothetical protein_gp297 [Bacillus phage vB_BceM_WH1]
MIDTEGYGVKRMFQKRFLVHSFLYYKLDDSIISDSDYDILCKKMIDAMNRVEKPTPYDDLCRPCGDTGSGFYIKEYPPEIVTSALRVLYKHKQQDPHFTQSFSAFISKWGYEIK